MGVEALQLQLENESEPEPEWGIGERKVSARAAQVKRRDIDAV